MYADQPGYHGVERFNDHDRMVELITSADAEGLSVHAHSVGSGATHFMLDCIEKVAKANIIATIVDGEEVYKA